MIAGLPEPPILSDPGDHLPALANGIACHQDIRNILDEVGPQPQPVIAPSVEGYCVSPARFRCIALAVRVARRLQ